MTDKLTHDQIRALYQLALDSQLDYEDTDSMAAKRVVRLSLAVLDCIQEIEQLKQQKAEQVEEKTIPKWLLDDCKMYLWEVCSCDHDLYVSRLNGVLTRAYKMGQSSQAYRSVYGSSVDE